MFTLRVIQWDLRWQGYKPKSTLNTVSFTVSFLSWQLRSVTHSLPVMKNTTKHQTDAGFTLRLRFPQLGEPDSELRMFSSQLRQGLVWKLRHLCRSAGVCLSPASHPHHGTDESHSERPEIDHDAFLCPLGLTSTHTQRNAKKHACKHTNTRLELHCLPLKAVASLVAQCKAGLVQHLVCPLSLITALPGWLSK